MHTNVIVNANMGYKDKQHKNDVHRRHGHHLMLSYWLEHL